MQNCYLQNAIRVNHRGFLKNSLKRFVLTENKTDSLDFSVVIMDDVLEKTVFSGKMKRAMENGETFYEGDFSSITKEGDYQILAGGFRSRQFIIYEKAYDICLRTMLEYFTYQRCGHPLGWNGECHLDDGFIKETGEKVDLRGGYHQSCDLRKSPGGVSIGVYAMLKYALKDTSSWGKILLKDEIKWACDYYVKTIQQGGEMYNTLNAPFGWKGREFYKSAAPSSAQWCATGALILGYRYFKEKDPIIAERYLECAKKSLSYMLSDKRSKEPYKHPDKYPIGMDPDFFYDQCYKDSVADIAYKISICADMYRGTNEEIYKKEIEKSISYFLNFVEDGYVLKRNDGTGRLITSSCSYTWLMGGLFALCDAYEILGDVCDLKGKIENACKSIATFMDKSIWKTAEIINSDLDLDSCVGHENKRKRECIGEIDSFGGYYFSKGEIFEPSYACYIGVFMARGSKLLDKEEYMKYAQYLADNLLGANVLDSSHIRSIGFNQPQHFSYGQFFPSTPFIPGAVGIGYKELDTYRISAEYDMPCVGMSMYLLSEISHK